MDAIDANEYLIQFLGSIDNLPSEIRHHFSEISNREQEIDDLLKGIERRKKRLWCLYDGGSFDSDCSVVEKINSKKKKHQVVKVITEFEDEEMLKEKVMNDYIRVSQLQDEKIEITDKALALVERYIKHFDEDLDSLFPQHNLRDCLSNFESTFESLNTSPQNVNIISLSSQVDNKTIVQPSNTSIKSTTSTIASFPTTSFLSSSISRHSNINTYDYNNGIYYPSMKSEEGEFSLPLLPNPSSSTAQIGRGLNRRNLSMSPNQPLPRRRRQINNNQDTISIYTNNINSITTSTTNTTTSMNSPITAASSSSTFNTTINDYNNNNSFPQFIKIQCSDGDKNHFHHLNSTGSSSMISPDRNINLNISFGEMIGCDGENCPIEWFHLDCVDLKAVPEGRWYCEHCMSTMNQVKKRKRGRPIGS
ncbi:1924_t:CDS:10 [Entrophospora sp. SA101]|nr:23132_t:CDS:10 [Entrophospora sp. SA101]CAJ0759237.1 1924_t:CDS:10 [Entrophospora sp. SA101]